MILASRKVLGYQGDGSYQHCEDADLSVLAVFWDVEIANVHDENEVYSQIVIKDKPDNWPFEVGLV